MQEGQRPPGAVDIALLILLACLWSSSFAFIKVAVETVPPMSVAAGRLSLAAALVVIVVCFQGHRFPTRLSVWGRFFLIGLFGNALPFFLISWGEVTIDSGLAAILMAVMPLATLLLAHVFTTDEKMNPARIIGVVLGFAGVVILIGPSALAGLGQHVLAQTAVAGGAVCYAVATIVAKQLPKLPLSVSSACTLLAAAFLSLPASLLFDRPWTMDASAESIGAVVVLGIFPTALALFLFFALLQRTGATFIALNNYLIPCLGVIWGIVFLAEEPSLRAFLALGVIMAGILATRIGMRGVRRPAHQSDVA